MSASFFRSQWKDQRGIAATEFALALPMLLLLLLGGFEYSRALLIHQKAERVAYTITDVVSQSTSVTNSQLNSTVRAASEIMQPYPFSTVGRVIISSVYKDGNNPATVRWQYSGGGSLIRSSRIGVVNGAATLPGGLTLNARDNVIVAEVFYNYTPIFNSGLINAGDIYKVAVYKPRLGALTTAPN